MNNSGELRKLECELRFSGARFVAGVDEAGRGPLAGPVVSAAVILPVEHDIQGIRDSKKLSEKKREILFDEIVQKAVSFFISFVSHEVIDEMNILRASLKSMAEAVSGLSQKPDHVLVDGNMKMPMQIRQTAIIGGDGKCECIAAASILAKVARDRFMKEQALIYPNFSFAKHKGYGTSLHIEELKKFGPTAIHRKTFIKNFCS